MRNLPDPSRKSPDVPLDALCGDWGRRNSGDFVSMLLELARAERGFRFYDGTDARRRPLADRAHRALTSELGRAGVVEFFLDERGFRLDGVDPPIESTGALAGLEKALRNHGLRRLRIDPSLTRDALVGFLDLLGGATGRYLSPDHFARTLAARDTRGIRINEMDSPGPTTAPDLRATPPRAAVSLASTMLADLDTATIERPAGNDEPTLENAPLESPSVQDRGERLRARLIELDATIDDDDYRSRVTDIVSWAEDLWNDELVDENYRAMLVLADHAVGHGGRTEAQARAAAAAFASLACKDRLEDLIDRATRTQGPSSSGIRAAQLLLQLGGLAVPRILDRLSSETDPNREAPLRSLIVTQGETALPHILSAIDGHDERRARMGIRLAGELQNPTVLPVLLEALRVPDLSRRIETIRALSFLPGEESRRALMDALASDLEEIAAAASEALATTDGIDAVPVLLDVLEESVQSTRTKLGRTLIEVLGRLGDERAVPRLCAILERRPVLRRAHWRAIQLATVDALAILPTKEARRSIERASLHAPEPVRKSAQAVLEALNDPA